MAAADSRIERTGQTDAIGDRSQQAAARVRDQAGSVRRDFYRETAPIAHHLQGDPSRVDPSTIDKPKNRCSGGQFSGPDPRGRYWLLQNPG